MALPVINHVREKRIEKGWTQEELAAQLDVSRQSVISIERGKYIPSLALALKMARIFKCTMEALFILEE